MTFLSVVIYLRSIPLLLLFLSQNYGLAFLRVVSLLSARTGVRGGRTACGLRLHLEVQGPHVGTIIFRCSFVPYLLFLLTNVSAWDGSGKQFVSIASLVKDIRHLGTSPQRQ